MLQKRNLLFLFLLIMSVLLLTGCFLNPLKTEGLLKGQVLVPEGTLKAKDLTGDTLPDATINIIDLTTGEIMATTVTDSTGHYQVFVPPGGPYLLKAVKGDAILEQITCSVEVGIEYDLGTVDCTTTAAALIAQAMIAEGENPEDIDCAAIMSDANFDDVSSIVCSTIKAGGDPTTSSTVEQAIEDFLNPTTPIPAPTYTVTFDSNEGSAVSPITGIAYNATITLPTAPIKALNTFAGWFSDDETFLVPFTASTPVAADIIVYAKWVGPVHNITQNTYYSIIQVALDDADSADIIEVDDGNYTENITFPGNKKIILQSTNGADLTTITGDDGSATVSCSNSLIGTTLEGFKIMHNNLDFGSGVDISSGNLIINNSTISGNLGPSGGISNSGILTITGSTIFGNFSLDSGGGISNSGILTITDSTISDNSATIAGGGIDNDGTLTITNSTIFGNSTNNDGGGIYTNSSGSITIGGSGEENIICGNYKTGQEPSLDQQIRNDSGSLYDTYKDINYISACCPTVINIAAIPGVTAPVTGENPVTTITETAQYTGTVTWDPEDANFAGNITGVTLAGNTVYTARITLTAKSGFTFIGVAENFFTVAGAETVTNEADSGIVTAVFPATDTVAVGESCGGGIVAYILQSNDGYYDEDKQHGLIAARADINSGEEVEFEWGCYDAHIGAGAEDVGIGQNNTGLIVNWLNSNTDNTWEDVTCRAKRAAYMCDAYSVTVDSITYDDWFLPSIGELSKLFINKEVIGGFVVDGRYWSSTEIDTTKAWYKLFHGIVNSSSSASKYMSFRVRAVRYF